MKENLSENEKERQRTPEVTNYTTTLECLKELAEQERALRKFIGRKLTEICLEYPQHHLRALREGGCELLDMEFSNQIGTVSLLFEEDKCIDAILFADK